MSSVVAHLCHAVLLLLIGHLSSCNVRFQALVEIDHTCYCVGNGEDDEYNCYYGYDWLANIPS